MDSLPVKVFVKENSRFYNQNPFEKIPSEVRNRIWELAVKERHALHLASPNEPGITATCRKYRSETLEMFYATNEFEIAVSHYNAVVPSATWVRMIKRIAANIGRDKTKLISRLLVDLGVFNGQQQQQLWSVALPIDWNMLRSLSEVFADDLKTRVYMNVDHPDPNFIGMLDVEWKAGDPAEGEAAIQSMSTLVNSDEDIWMVDPRRVADFDVTCRMLLSVVQAMPEF